MSTPLIKVLGKWGLVSLIAYLSSGITGYALQDGWILHLPDSDGIWALK